MCCEGCLVALMMGISVTDRRFLYLAAHTTETTPPNFRICGSHRVDRTGMQYETMEVTGSVEITLGSDFNEINNQ